MNKHNVYRELLKLALLALFNLIILAIMGAAVFGWHQVDGRLFQREHRNQTEANVLSLANLAQEDVASWRYAAAPAPDSSATATSTPIPEPTSTSTLAATATPLASATPDATANPLPGARSSPPVSTAQVEGASAPMATAVSPPVAAPDTLVSGSALPERAVTRIRIPALQLDVPVLMAPIANNTWAVDHLEQAVGHLEGTASPGTQNNVVLAGHVTLPPDGRSGPFKHLASLQPGAEVVVYHQEQAFRYRIESLQAVTPQNIEVTFPSTEPRLTLITCLNYDATLGRYSQRLVATARLVP